MTQFKRNLIAPFGAITILAGVSSLERLYIHIKKRHRKRQAIIALSKLDDRQLDDIGISRADIHSDLRLR